MTTPNKDQPKCQNCGNRHPRLPGMQCPVAMPSFQPIGKPRKLHDKSCCSIRPLNKEDCVCACHPKCPKQNQKKKEIKCDCFETGYIHKAKCPAENIDYEKKSPCCKATITGNGLCAACGRWAENTKQAKPQEEKTDWDDKEVLAKMLHEWYLEACLKPESGLDFNPAAQEPYEALKDTQKFLDRYIAERVIDFLQQEREKAVRECVEAVNGRIVKDEQVIVETPEHKFARGFLNQALQDIQAKLQDLLK